MHHPAAGPLKSQIKHPKKGAPNIDPMKMMQTLPRSLLYCAALLVSTCIALSTPKVEKKPISSVNVVSEIEEVPTIPGHSVYLPSDFICSVETKLVQQDGKDLVKILVHVKNAGLGNYDGKSLFAVVQRYTRLPPKTYGQCADLYVSFNKKIGSQLMSGMTLSFEVLHEIPGFLRLGISPQNENEKGAVSYYSVSLFPEDETGGGVLGSFSPKEDSNTENTSGSAEEFRYTLRLE